jgi:hypothetical protein
MNFAKGDRKLDKMMTEQEKLLNIPPPQYNLMRIYRGE